MSLWDQLNSRTLFGSEKATASEVNAQTKDIHIQKNNRALLTDTVLINRSLMRDSGSHIPGTQEIKNAASTESSTRVPIFTPSAGEVWQIDSAVIDSVEGGSGDVVYELFIFDGTELMSVLKRTQTTPPVNLAQEGEFWSWTIDENVGLQFNATRSGLSACSIQVLMHRVR